MTITEQIGDEDSAMVIVWPCLKGTVLDCLMWTSMWLGEWELGTSVMSLELRWIEGSNGPLQVNSLDLKNPKGKGEGRPKHNMVQIIGKFRFKVGVNRMENCKGNGKQSSRLVGVRRLMPVRTFCNLCMSLSLRGKLSSR